MDRTRVVVWLVRVFWISLPLTVGPTVAAAFSSASRPVQVVAAVGLWIGWGVGLAASLVPTTVSLTVLRLLAPAPLAVAAIATLVEPRAAGAVAVVTGLLVGALALRREVGRVFVQGSAYGDEARFPLRPPGTLVVGPLPMLWLALVTATAAGPLLLAARQWLGGLVLTLVAAALLVVLPRRFHRLSRRFLAVVPAGLAVHDHVALLETAMFRWRAIDAIGKALAGTRALDVTAHALGPALEVRFTAPETLVVAGRPRTSATTVRADAILCSPTLLDAAIDSATRRRKG